MGWSRLCGVQSVNLEVSIPYIRVCGKGDKERIIALTGMTADHLKEYMKVYHPEKEICAPLIYTVIKGYRDRMSVGNIERIVKKYTEQIRPKHPNLPKNCYPHMVQWTKSTNMYRMGQSWN